MHAYGGSPRIPRELAHSDTDTTMAAITAVADITDLASLSFTVTDYPVYVVLFVPIISSASNASQVAISITDAANAATANAFINLASGQSDCLQAVERISTPGAYVRKGRVQRTSGTGTVSLGLTATEVTYFYAAERAAA